MASSDEVFYPAQSEMGLSVKMDCVLGGGCFGEVVKCYLKGSKEKVAVKIPKEYTDFEHEASMMKFLMENKLDEHNIIKFFGRTGCDNKCLVFELLDTSLLEHLMSIDRPMLLKDIRTVIQQLATALEALKTFGIIHTDLKPDNIMMVDQIRQPFKVKLIDFGLAIFKSQAKPGRSIQPPFFRAPEVILKLPYSEAIDMWSLGCVLAIMQYQCMLFTSKVNYGNLKTMISLLGPPPQHLLQPTFTIARYFKLTGSRRWVLMTPDEFFGEEYEPDKFFRFTSLDESKMMRLEDDNENEEIERSECVELMKAMLRWDANERITPAAIHTHPFITKSYLNSSPCNEPQPSTSDAQTRTNESVMEKVHDQNSVTYPGVIMVQPAPPENRISLGEDYNQNNVRHPRVLVVRSPFTKHRNSLGEADNQDCVMDPEPISDQMDSEGSTTFGDDREQKKKKKKNCFRRILSWVRKKFVSSNRNGPTWSRQMSILQEAGICLRVLPAKRELSLTTVAKCLLLEDSVGSLLIGHKESGLDLL